MLMDRIAETFNAGHWLELVWIFGGAGFGIQTLGFQVFAWRLDVQQRENKLRSFGTSEGFVHMKQQHRFLKALAKILVAVDR
jgi:hypothetical protein